MFEHFNKEDKEFVKKILNLKGKYVLTKFLDLNQQDIVNRILPDAVFYGGYENAESKRAIVSDLEEYNITCYKIKYDKRFGVLKHRNILGSVMSLGIEKNNIGDIVIEDDIFIFIASEIKKYFELNFTQIGKINIEIIEVDGSNIVKKENYSIKKVFSSSLRLDNIVSTVYNCSRNESKNLINKGFVRINHRLIENISYSISKNDLVSVRTKGRFIILDEIGRSKKDNYILNIGIY
ncbi:YlmH/Sll1252 family protein [Mycoplasmatota bacterium WC44]